MVCGAKRRQSIMPCEQVEALLLITALTLITVLILITAVLLMYY